MAVEKSTKGPSAAVSAYLVAYNTLQTLGWSLIGLIIGQQVLGTGPDISLYFASYKLLQIFQTAAILEVVHCAVGFVRSNVVLTAFQVASRVFLVWGVLFSVPETQSSNGYPMLLLAWTITEIIRYSYYVLNIGKIPAYPLLWLRSTGIFMTSAISLSAIGLFSLLCFFIMTYCRLTCFASTNWTCSQRKETSENVKWTSNYYYFRSILLEGYTLFIILYPIGVSGELMCIFQALKPVAESGLYSLRMPNKYNFAFDYQYALVIVMISYVPVFPQLYMHMFIQRRKTIGGFMSNKANGLEKKKAQ